MLEKQAGRNKRGLVPWQAERGDWCPSKRSDGGVTIAEQPHHPARAVRTMPGHMRSQTGNGVEASGYPRQSHRVHGVRARRWHSSGAGVSGVSPVPVHGTPPRKTMGWVGAQLQVVDTK